MHHTLSSSMMLLFLLVSAVPMLPAHKADTQNTPSSINNTMSPLQTFNYHTDCFALLLNKLKEGEKLVHSLLQNELKINYQVYVDYQISTACDTYEKIIMSYASSLDDTWPTVDIIGENRSQILLDLVIQRTTNRSFSSKCFVLLNNLLSKKIAAFIKDPYAKKLFMHLYDYFDFLSKGQTTFGMLGQVIPDSKGKSYWHSYPIRDPRHANEFRTEIGIPTIKPEDLRYNNGQWFILLALDLPSMPATTECTTNKN